MLGPAFAWNKTKTEFLGYCDHFQKKSDSRIISGQIGFFEHCQNCKHYSGNLPKENDKEFRPGCVYRKKRVRKPFTSRFLENYFGWLRRDKIFEKPVLLYRTEVFAGESQKGGKTQYFCRNCNYEMSPNIFETEIWEGCTCPKCMAVVTNPKVLKNGEEIKFDRELDSDTDEIPTNSESKDENDPMNNK